MKNIALCIGCDHYDALPALSGAEVDAKRVHDSLHASDLYDHGTTHLLRSPSLREARKAFDDFIAEPGLGVVSVYFAGHGAVKAGTFYLCLRDSLADKLSTTALPIAEFLRVVGELQPRQANVVLDACQAGGAMYDLHSLLKPEVIGQAESSSMAFLAASASDQYAREDAAGGICTSAMLRYLEGERSVQDRRPHLDLVELGQAVSRDVVEIGPDQIPVAWGLNLYGQGAFATNPFFTGKADPAFLVDGIAPSTDVGMLIQTHAESLWSEHRSIMNEHDPARLCSTLASVRQDLGENYRLFLPGFATTLSSRAERSNDLLAGSEALAACAVSLLPRIAEAADLAVCREILRERAVVDHRTAAGLLERLQEDEYSLLNHHSMLGDLHYLPLRVSRLLAWTALSGLINKRLGFGEASDLQLAADLAATVVRIYEGSLVAVSDEQAPHLFVLAIAAEELGWDELAASVLDRHFESAVRVAGRFSRIGASGEEVLRYTLARGAQAPVAHHEFANPTELLSVLLICGHRLNLAERWDSSMEEFDGRAINAYVPDDYACFDDAVMGGGRNYTVAIGHGFWTLEDYAGLIESEVEPSARSAFSGPPEARLLCGLAACLFPNRTPYCLSEAGLSVATT